jgi:20S proteasome subunit beta 3
MSILSYNGGAVLAMSGKNCVAIASDSRLGVQAQTVATDFKRIFKMHDHLYVGLSGLATDIQTVEQKLRFRINMYKLREERNIKPKTFASVFSHMLYERRFGPYFVEPVVAGLDENNQPYITAMDLLGCPVDTKDFVVAGTCSENLYGMCESLYRPDMEPDDLFETIAQCLLSSVDRDALSGWGGEVIVLTPEGATIRTLKGRQD